MASPYEAYFAGDLGEKFTALEIVLSADISRGENPGRPPLLFFLRTVVPLNAALRAEPGYETKEIAYLIRTG